jgi:hypothetical protein
VMDFNKVEFWINLARAGRNAANRESVASESKEDQAQSQAQNNNKLEIV